MDKKEYDSFAKNCIIGGLPPCGGSCPLNLDIPAIVRNMQIGDFSAAYRQYRNQSVFPAVVSEICPQYCLESCVRKNKDDSISLLLLERACVEFTASDKPSNYNLPKRVKRIAVIGGGLAGLTCALKLGTKGYDVSLYEKSGALGGRLHGLLDPGIFLPEIERQMQFAHCNIELGREIISLDDIDFDAVYVATGRGGAHFGLIDPVDGNSFASAREGVFIGGAILGAEPVEDIAQAVVASHSIEKYIKISKMDGIPETFIRKGGCIAKDMGRVAEHDPVKPADGHRYSKEEAVSEARRCLLCDCTECRDACELFDFFRKNPKQIAGEAMTSLHSKAGITKQVATKLIASCNLCGLCGKVCPEGIDMGQLAYDFRYFTAQSKTYPPAFSDFFIRDMIFSNETAGLIRSAPGYERAKHLFFPGCQLGAGDPNYVVKSYRYLLERFPDTAIMLGCCGAPADWGTEKALNQKTIDKISDTWNTFGKPVIIFACPTCQRQLNKYLPEAKQISLYEIIAENGLPEGGAKLGQTLIGQKPMCVFDPCTARDNMDMHESVRRIAAMSGAKLEELFYSREKARCCGWGGHIRSANPILADRIVDNRIQASENPYIAYCTNCRDTFAWKGKECVHILDLVFGLNKDGDTPPSLGARRKNKLLAKKMLQEQCFGEISQETKEDAPVMKEDALTRDEHALNIEISSDMIEKMNRLLILEEEACRVIEHCETTGNKFYDVEKNCFIGHLQIGIITYWVNYEKHGDKYILTNVYSHRMEILDGTGGGA